MTLLRSRGKSEEPYVEETYGFIKRRMRMPTLRRYNIFISHAWKYGDEYDRLVEMLREAPNFEFLNWSAPEDKPVIPQGMKVPDRKIKEEIEKKIKMADCVLVLGGMYAAYSDWMQAEIDIAKNLPRPLIGIKPWGNKQYPSSVLAATKVDVGWNTPTIVQEIRNNARAR